MPTQDLKKEFELYTKAKEDIKNFDAIYKYFLNDVYRFTYSLIGNQHDAEDLASNTFIEFYKKFPSFEWQNKSMKSWLFTTANNFARNKFRLKTMENIEDENLVVDEVEISFVDEIIQKDLLEEIKREIQKLSPIERSIVNLRIWEGLSFAEIASIHELKEDTARIKFHRSVQKLRKNLEKKGSKIFALPLLFTGIVAIGKSTAYAAPGSLIKSEISTLLNQQTMNSGITTIKTFLASKAGIVIASTVVLATIVAGGTGIYLNTRPKSSNPETVSVQVTSTPTVEQTVTTTATAVPTVTQDPYANWKTYDLSKDSTTYPTFESDNFTIKYPSNWKVSPAYEGCGPIFTPSEGNQGVSLSICSYNLQGDYATEAVATYNSVKASQGYSVENPIKDITIGGKEAKTYTLRNTIPNYSTRLEGTYDINLKSKSGNHIVIYTYVTLNENTKVEEVNSVMDSIVQSIEFK